MWEEEQLPEDEPPFVTASPYSSKGRAELIERLSRGAIPLKYWSFRDTGGQANLDAYPMNPDIRVSSAGVDALFFIVAYGEQPHRR